MTDTPQSLSTFLLTQSEQRRRAASMAFTDREAVLLEEDARRFKEAAKMLAAWTKPND